jgi:arabinofuranosyltransferase
VLAEALALPLAYQVFRMGYFGSLVPNTAISKEASLSNWNQGGLYLYDFLRPYHLWVPLAVAAALIAGALRAAHRRRGRRRVRLLALTLGPIVAGLVHAVYWVRVGGDFMHGRMLLPAWVAVLSPVAVVAAPRGRPPALGATVLVPWALATAIFLRVPYIGGDLAGRGPDGIAEEHFYYTRRAGRTWPVTIADYKGSDWKQDGDRLRALAELKRILEIPGVRASDPVVDVDLAPSVPSDLAVAEVHLGILGYAAGLRVHVVDRRGLADAVAAHIEIVGRGRPGHEKWMDSPWIAARYAQFPERYPPGGHPSVKARDAQAALACGDLAELMDATTAPLTAARFAKNVGRAWRLTRLRYPGDAAVARAALCGG